MIVGLVVEFCPHSRKISLFVDLWLILSTNNTKPADSTTCSRVFICHGGRFGLCHRIEPVERGVAFTTITVGARGGGCRSKFGGD